MSTSNALMRFVQNVKEGFNTRKSTLAVFIDLKGAYDTVWRGKLLDKLKKYGVRGCMLSWFTRFLAQRWVKTRWDDSESTYQQSQLGLPQGAVSSTVLFNAYINDLPERLKKVKGIKISMFTDDVVIWTSAKNTSRKQKGQLQDTINSALEEVNSWALENNMKISKTKTVYQYFSLQHQIQNFELKLENEHLEKSTNTKYLGVVLDNKLNWTEQVNIAAKKATSRLGVIKRLAGAKWGSTQDTLNITYNTYVKPVMKYGSEVIATANETRLNVLERAQNNALRLICGGTKTTPVTALQQYTGNLPMKDEVKKQAATTYTKMTASQQASWISQHDITANLRTQITPIEICKQYLRNINVTNKIGPLCLPINPINYTTTATNLSLTEHYKKKDTPPDILRYAALSTMNEKYPEDEWLRVYTDGSHIEETGETGAGVYSKLFAQYAPVGKNRTNFDGELKAIYLALQQLIYRPNQFNKVVLLVDSQAAIHAATSNKQPQTAVLYEIRQALKHLKALNKSVAFQWVPSHIGLEGNEHADELAKKGTTIKTSETTLEVGAMKKLIASRTKIKNKLEAMEQSENKKWHKIRDEWDNYKKKPRREAVAHFRLRTGHDCLAAHLNRMGIVLSAECTICRAQNSTMDEDHLLHCSGLNRTHQREGNLAKLYWEARQRMG